MATRTSTAFYPSNTTNAIRDWAQFVEDTLVTTGGWVVTSDTGQTLPSALVTPGATNTKAGYRIYRMADTLQSTSPVFIRIDFGSSPSGAATPGIWIIIGTGSNGSGTITGQVFNTGAANALCYCGGTSTTLGNLCFGSATTSRVTLAMFVYSSNTYVWAFGIERSKDASGADTGAGLLFSYTDSVVGTGVLNASNYLILAGGSQPSKEGGMNYIITSKNPSETFAPGDIGAGVVMHFKGLVQQPGMNFMITNANDVADGGSFSLSMYGATRTYQNLRSLIIYKSMAGNSTGVSDTNVRGNIRYD